MILDDFVLENWQPLLVVGDSMFLGGGLKYVLLGDEVTADNFRGDDKTTWRIGVLVWPKTVCNHDYKTLAQVWLLV
jgi:hypothetical protein